MTETVTRAVERGLRWAILVVFGIGARRRDPAAVVNAALALAVTFVPDAVERAHGVAFEPWQRLYTDAAMVAHAIGMLGLYDEQGSWDHLTHTLSASLLGGVVYVVSSRHGRDPRPRVLAATVFGGGLWELLEYAIHAISDRLGLEPLLVPYSARDTVLDLVFDAVGGLLVVAFGDRLLENFTRRSDP